MLLQLTYSQSSLLYFTTWKSFLELGCTNLCTTRVFAVRIKSVSVRIRVNLHFIPFTMWLIKHSDKTVYVFTSQVVTIEFWPTMCCLQDESEVSIDGTSLTPSSEMYSSTCSAELLQFRERYNLNTENLADSKCDSSVSASHILHLWVARFEFILLLASF